MDQPNDMSPAGDVHTPATSSGDTGATDTAPTSASTASSASSSSSDAPAAAGEGVSTGGDGAGTPRPAAKKRRRGSRGGQRRKRPAGSGGAGQPGGAGASGHGSTDDDDDIDDVDDGVDDDVEIRSGNGRTVDRSPDRAGDRAGEVELPERMSEGRPSPDAANSALVRRPQIGDTRPAPSAPPPPPSPSGSGQQRGDRRQGGSRPPRSGGQGAAASGAAAANAPAANAPGGSNGPGARSGEGSGPRKRKRNNRSRSGDSPRQTGERAASVEIDPEVLERRRGRERKGRPVGRYMMCVHVGHGLTQVAVLEGRNLIEHYVSRPSDDVSQIHSNIYLGRVQNVLPGMEACFVDIATPKNAVLYAGDVQYDAEDIVERSADKPRIEQVLKNRQLILCQVTKNPIGVKGARLTQEVSLPGRFVVLIPNSKTIGISKRLPDDERKRLRSILDRVKEADHGLIVRTAAENATEQELRADVLRLNETWREIEQRAEAARRANRAQLLYREPDLAVRVIREEFNAEYRSIVIDDRALYEEVRGYVEVMNPELVDRVEFYDAEAEGLGLYERFHVHEQLHKALDRKVWLPSGGSLIIEHTEALTVIDVNTGRNVGTSNLEATVLQNNLEAAEEIARQLRLRDIGGIIVIDFIDMEIKENRRKVVDAFRGALSRDKTRSQVFDISELGLVEMTRKRIGEGLLQSFATQCPNCEGRGVDVNTGLLD
jgi:ribonuclease E